MRFLGRTTLALSLAVAVLVPAQLAAAESPSEPGGQRLLAERNRGQAAITALGENADEAARVNGLSASEFKRRLVADKSVWVGRDGRMFYVDSAAEAHEAAEAEATTEVQAASAALEDTFVLHSLPGSNHTIYLDFGSNTLASNSWWVTDGGMSAQTFTGYSQDGDPAFNDTEKTFVQQVWSIVAEKYAAFDVDVTTENPGSNGYNRTTPGDLTWGTRVAITSDDNALAEACGTCAGVALIDVFDTVDTGQYEPAWVFTDLLGTATLTANAAAHEVGHTFGLGHDGTASTSYYSGHNHWVPIMGITNSKAVAQFSKGEYSGANNTENDLAIIAGNGAPLRSDDAGNTTGTATALPSAASYEVNGIITSATDKDVYAVSRDCVNDLTATATGIGTGQTLDLKVSVYNTAGTLVGADDVASSNVGAVATGMNAEYIAASAAASTYYVEVDGVGSGGLGNVPNPSTGYTDYASIGQYTLAITGCPVSTDPPTAPQSITASPTLRSTNGSVSWSAPASNGGGPITGYTVTGMPGGAVNVGAATTSIATTSLVPGTTYAVSVIATNAYGDSPSADVNLKVPTWVPSAAPTVSPTATGKDASATWTSIANPGLATITGWDTVLKRGLTTVASSTVLVADPRSISYTDLAPGSYTLSVTVAATAEDSTGATAGTANFTIDGDKPSAPQNLTADHTAKTTTGTVSWTAPASEGDAPVTGYTVGGLPGPDVNTTNTNIVATGLTPGATYNVSVVANNTYGSSTAAATSLDVDTWVPTTPPVVNVSVGTTSGNVSWSAPANPGGATVTGWTVVLTRPSGTPITRNLSAATLATSFTGLTPGAHSVAVTVVATADDTVGETSGTKAFTVPSKPSAPKIGTPSFGTKGGAITAIARWAAPTSTGGSPITGYRVIAYKLTAADNIAKAYYSKVLPASARSYKWTTLPAGKYKFRVVAYNAVGTSPYSAYSTKVLAQ